MQEEIDYKPYPYGAYAYSRICVPVLEFLKGQPFDDVAMNLLDSLRPSCVRVCRDHACINADAQRWRVTVYLENNLIKRIEQEVQVGLRGDFEHGHHLSQTLHERGVNLGNRP